MACTHDIVRIRQTDEGEPIVFCVEDDCDFELSYYDKDFDKYFDFEDYEADPVNHVYRRIGLDPAISVKVQRADPDTCEHRLAQSVIFSDERDYIIVCVSCDSTLDQEYVAEHKWIYDIDYNVWRRLTKAEVLIERRLAAEGFKRSLEPASYYRRRRVEWSQAPEDSGD
jgi:hypothetical protein